MKPEDTSEPTDHSTDNGSAVDASTPAASTDEEKAIDELAAELDVESQPSDLEAELAEAQGRALRAQAELENFRKRSRREMEESKRYATIPLIRDLLPVIDNLDRALQAAEKDDAASGLQEGVQMVAQQLQTVLAQHNCVPIEAEGQPFDPMFHEAIQELPHDEVPRGHVAMVHQIGYRLHDRVIRPSQVIVSRGPTDQPEE